MYPGEIVKIENIPEYIRPVDNTSFIKIIGDLASLIVKHNTNPDFVKGIAEAIVESCSHHVRINQALILVKKDERQ